MKMRPERVQPHSIETTSPKSEHTEPGAIVSMTKPRYDENENKSRHAAADEDCCEEMAEKYGWQLVDVEKTGDDILEVDCVFEGETEFPKSYYDTEEEAD